PTFAVDPATGKPVLKVYIVDEDDTLWDLANEFYGKPWVWPLFLKFNSIANPDLIHPGQKLLFPSYEVLQEIKQSSPEEVVKVREELQKQNTPEPVTRPAPVSQAALTPKEVVVKPLPTPEKTPTFKVTGSKTINVSYAQAVGSGGSGSTNTGYDR